MTPEEKIQFQEMKDKIQEMEENVSLLHVEQLLDILIPERPEVVDADVDVTISIGSEGGSAQVLRFPERWLNFAIQGEIYRVGAWLKKND